ncbi:MAG: hypothetical protein KJ573_03785 [Proteobacteria bacterium]|nr:hypothetical protein [Desulfobacterales bacterium]MBL6968512.1 hypothetical protein [Desulfobacteraceae bacterium]MBU0734010.1 hypothetical protein [Pseudomonadota bacterium]MBL7102307.1 hypothetical protein [Desulfobacteraceae bacterium]MBL7171407.1 hypothetical protein [Desulfobacteraceae bacterium]
MLAIHPIMNSAVEDIFGFKTCCGMRAFDQNLEIHVKNVGEHPVVVSSYFDMKGAWGSRRMNTLMPGGGQRILPGEIKAFYCTMDEVLWNEARGIVFYDSEANAYPVELKRAAEK